MLLFDLNGFKHYNDTFGHPAGDELLVRLGGALRDAVGEDGDRLPDRRRRVLRAAHLPAGALRHGHPGRDESADRNRPGIRSELRLGAVAVPAEESEPSAALQLADVRMYAQKESAALPTRTFSSRP